MPVRAYLMPATFNSWRRPQAADDVFIHGIAVSGNAPLI
ncbi:hypothetical protein Q7O_002288 [Pectobacterium carotovorum subsp. carotovorum PCCS1]|nr:hypothetical protein [Pectobacterium carotovorum subsp. carotovorum PCCS1]